MHDEGVVAALSAHVELGRGVHRDRPGVAECSACGHGAGHPVLGAVGQRHDSAYRLRRRSRGYFPGPDRWACRELAAAAPTGRHTSGITQPPFMRSQYSASSTALGRVVDPTGSWLSSSSTAAGRTWCAGTGGWLRPATQLNAVGSPSTTGGSPGWTTRRGGTAPTRT